MVSYVSLRQLCGAIRKAHPATPFRNLAAPTRENSRVGYATREWVNAMQRKGSEATREPATRERLGRKNSGERGVRLVRLTVEDSENVSRVHGLLSFFSLSPWYY